MRNAVSILRVSTKPQLNEGDGIENQRRGNAEYIRRKRYRSCGEFVIAETADDKERADFGAVLDAVIARKKEIDVVVFWKVDRLSRGGVGNYYALKALLAKHGVRIEFATEQIDATPTGELMESLLAATARFENRLRVDRTVGVEKILTKEGYWCRVVGECLWFLKHASELWEKWPVDLQNRLQVMVFPEGVGYGVLEGEANPTLSLVYAAIADAAREDPMVSQSSPITVPNKPTDLA